MYKYQEYGRYFAQVAGGLEDEGAAELERLGATDTAEAYRGVHFTADLATIYRINYQARLITRVLAPLTSFNCHNADYLYRTARDIDWTDFLTLDQTFAVFANVSNSKIDHSKYAALRVKDAIVDQFRDRTGQRPNIDTRDPNVWFNLYIENNHATISLDTSGGSLHRRGYRQASGSAPMQETVAAAVIRLSDWDGQRRLVDPMCGSGTLLAEAVMHYCRIPSGYLQQIFGFRHLPDFDEAVWNEVRDTADAAIRPLPDGFISGSDKDPKAVGHARQNLARLPEGHKVPLEVTDYRKRTDLAGVTLVMNPPYGRRMGRGSSMGAFYKELGDYMKQECTGSTAYIYAGERSLLKRVGLRSSWKKPLVNGALDGRLAKYDLY